MTLPSSLHLQLCSWQTSVRTMLMHKLASDLLVG